MRAGILTGGGDCPGLNAVIRATTRRLLDEGWEVVGVREGWRPSLALAALKLAACPAAVLAIAWLLHLPARETQAIVMLASLPVGANVYLMARQFGALEGPVAATLVLTTLISALSTSRSRPRPRRDIRSFPPSPSAQSAPTRSSRAVLRSC